MQLEQQNNNDILDTFYRKLGKNIYCADVKQQLHKENKYFAQHKKYIQYNTDAFLNWVAVDVDHNIYIDDCISPNAPKPNLLVQNTENHKSHLFYLLENPVCKTENSHYFPLRFANDCRAGLTEFWDADKGFSGFVSKNPLSNKFITYPLRNEPYKLIELSKFGRKNEIKYDAVFQSSDIGRNVTLVHEIRQIAYRERALAANSQAFYNVLMYELSELNKRFPTGLNQAELANICRSVATWTWQNYTPQRQKFWANNIYFKNNNIEVQSQRGKKSGEVRATKAQARKKAVICDFNTGKFTREELAVKYKVSRQTIFNYLKSN